MSSQQPGPSVATPPSPKTLRSANPPRTQAQAAPDRSAFWTFAVLGTVVLAIGCGILAPVLLRSFAAPAAPAAAAPQPEPAKAVEGKDHALETIGSLTAANLYQGYLNIGLLADAHENDIYQAAEADKLLDTVTRMLANVDRHLAQMDSLKDEDKEAVEQARKLSSLLLLQARELRAYWQTGVKDHADKFQKARQQSLAGVQALLGLDD